MIVKTNMLVWNTLYDTPYTLFVTQITACKQSTLNSCRYIKQHNGVLVPILSTSVNLVACR